MTSVSLLLPACGGGGDAAEVIAAALGQATRTVNTSAQSASTPPDAVTDTRQAPGLVGAAPAVVDSTRTGQRLLKAVGALDDGGYVVVWMSREPQDTEPSWPMWLQRLDTQGRKAGPAYRLPDLPDVRSCDDVAVTVLPEGRIGVTFLTDRVEDAVFGITEVHHWPLNLEGTTEGALRVLDVVRYPRFSPRFATLGGPVAAVPARDGSHYVAWRYRIVGAAPLAPSVRAQRLAADGEPLGWIQQLDGEGGFSRVLRVQVTSMDEGGWIVGEERVSSGGVRYNTFTQLDVARPLGFPVAETHASDSFVVDLRGHGSVLFTRSVDPQTGELGTPRRIHFDTRGRAEPTREFGNMPGAVAALRGGDYITFDLPGSLVVVQRYTPNGELVGAAFETAALSAAVLPAGLHRGGAAIAWVTTGAGGEVQVLTQRLLDPAQP